MSTLKKQNENKTESAQTPLNYHMFIRILSGGNLASH